MALSSVKAPQLGPDAHLPAQDAREHPSRRRALEAREVAARVRAATRLCAACHELALARGEAHQLALRRPPPATGAAPQRSRDYEDSS
jgi:hypothetical protein